MMPNESKKASEKRSGQERRQNAQGDHEGSAHTPDEFDTINPQKQSLADKNPLEPLNSAAPAR